MRQKGFCNTFSTLPFLSTVHFNLIMNLMQRLLADFSKTQHLTQRGVVCPRMPMIPARGCRWYLPADADDTCTDTSTQCLSTKGRLNTGVTEPQGRTCFFLLILSSLKRTYSFSFFLTFSMRWVQDNAPKIRGPCELLSSSAYKATIKKWNKKSEMNLREIIIMDHIFVADIFNVYYPCLNI